MSRVYSKHARGSPIEILVCESKTIFLLEHWELDDAREKFDAASGKNSVGRGRKIL